MKTKLFDNSILTSPREAIDLISNVLESSTEYSIIGKSLDGTIILWNEGARRLYGYQAEEVLGKLNAEVLHSAEDIRAGLPRQMTEEALRSGRWEGLVKRVRKNGETFPARVVVTPRRDNAGRAIGLLIISKDISLEMQSEQAEEKFRGLLESAPDAMVIVNEHG